MILLESKSYILIHHTFLLVHGTTGRCMFESRFLHLVFIEIYLIILNSYPHCYDRIYAYNYSLCVLNYYVSFYKVTFIIYLPLKVSMSHSDFEPDTAARVSGCRASANCATWHLAEIGIGCSYMSIFIHSDMNW